MFCPIMKSECCETGCALWSFDNEECALLLMGEGMRELSFAADEANLDCGIRVHVTRRGDID
ncbi:MULTISPECIES: hypothetical protein [Eisenbergiella]|uniref:hypothetical protein n=1 Tax=Eisenbergiella TaxID=1432051 RepID=UPI0023F21D37|nr:MULTISPECIES: hypothetical protein [Eisenbergiella]MCI6708530.1 hypothetical protein [Eisenbergiella massiliensis]MDY5529318.1 hypothetical protein [Eisenbergiella porci]